MRAVDIYAQQTGTIPQYTYLVEYTHTAYLSIMDPFLYTNLLLSRSTDTSYLVFTEKNLPRGLSAQ